MSNQGATAGVRPLGGYRLIAIDQLCWVWSAYRDGQVGYRDLRVWFAAHEMSARRCRLDRGRTPQFTLEELNGLVGGAGGRHLRASVRRLERAGCLFWRTSSLGFPPPSDAGAGDENFQRMMGLIANNRRRLPVPRRTLRLLARTSAPVGMATMLGFLLRCVYLKGGLGHSIGCCKASWVGDVFTVDPRNVRRSKQGLAAAGWLQRARSDHWHRQRWGGRVEVNLAWGGAGATARRAVTRSPYQQRRIATNLPYLVTNKNLPSEVLNTKPVAPRPGGASAKRNGGGSGAGSKSPLLSRVTSEDLSDADRLERLWLQARERRLVGGSDAERLSFFAAAERARRVATRNAPGFFVTVVRAKLWRVIGQCDEDRARAKLRTLRATTPGARARVPDPIQARGPLLPDVPPAGRPVSCEERGRIRQLIADSLASVA